MNNPQLLAQNQHNWLQIQHTQYKLLELINHREKLLADAMNLPLDTESGKALAIRLLIEAKATNHAVRLLDPETNKTK